MGWMVGLSVGRNVGLMVGWSVGENVGSTEGISVGPTVGDIVGLNVGNAKIKKKSTASDSSTKRNFTKFHNVE